MIVTLSLGMGQKGLAAWWCVQLLHPCLGLCSYSRSTIRIGARWGHQNSACAQQFQRTKKLTAATVRFANNVHFQPWAKFMRVGSRLAKSRFEKLLHACIVASHVVNRARDACCPQSLT